MAVFNAPSETSSKTWNGAWKPSLQRFCESYSRFAGRPNLKVKRIVEFNDTDMDSISANQDGETILVPVQKTTESLDAIVNHQACLQVTVRDKHPLNLSGLYHAAKVSLKPGRWILPLTWPLKLSVATATIASKHLLLLWRNNFLKGWSMLQTYVLCYFIYIVSKLRVGIHKSACLWAPFRPSLWKEFCTVRIWEGGRASAHCYCSVVIVPLTIHAFRVLNKCLLQVLFPCRQWIS